MSGLLDYARLDQRRHEVRSQRRGRGKVFCPGCGGKVKQNLITDEGVCRLCAELRQRRAEWAERFAIEQARMQERMNRAVLR